MSVAVIIVAGGSGKRMGTDRPKQFLPLAGKTVLQHTLEAFHKVDPTFRFIIAMHPDFISFWKDHAEMKKINIPHEVVSGGAERFHSVQNALELVREEELVAIHDAVRPFISPSTLKKLLQTARAKGAAIPFLPLKESLRKVDGELSVAVNRTDFVTVQTPQVFTAKALKEAYRQNFQTSFTDDASVWEATGRTVHLVEGNPENIKLTTPEDLQWAELYLSSHS